MSIVGENLSKDMPRYDYHCGKCGLHVEVIHSIAECDNPSEETQKEISCNEYTCPMAKEPDKFKNSTTIITHYGFPFKRGVSAPNLHGVVGGTSVGQRGVLLEKQKERKLRSRKHFKKEVMPGLDKPDKQHFERKYKDLDVRGNLK